jgi:hypothetical protein
MRPSLSILMSVSLLLSIAATSRADQPMPRTVTTSGEAVVYVTPDEVTVTVGVEVFDENLDNAKRKNDQQSGTLIKAIKSLGVDEKQIQTDNLQLEVQYKDNRAWEGLRGFIARRVYVVTLKNTKLFEKIVDASLKNGANQLMGFAFRTTELRKYRDQARTMAIKAAKEKAIAMAKDLECGVGKPWQITEGYSGSGRYEGNAQVLANDARALPGGEDEGELLPLGQIAIRAQVSVVFDLTDK